MALGFSTLVLLYYIGGIPSLVGTWTSKSPRAAVRKEGLAERDTDTFRANGTYDARTDLIRNHRVIQNTLMVHGRYILHGNKLTLKILGGDYAESSVSMDRLNLTPLTVLYRIHWVDSAHFQLIPTTRSGAHERTHLFQLLSRSDVAPNPPTHHI